MKNNHFTIVILSYNNEDWVSKNLGSAINQDYDNYDVVYVEDASTDGTREKVKSMQESWDHKKGILTLICNLLQNSVALLEFQYVSKKCCSLRTAIYFKVVLLPSSDHIYFLLFCDLNEKNDFSCLHVHLHACYGLIFDHSTSKRFDLFKNGAVQVTPN